MGGGHDRNETWHKGSLGVRLMPEHRVHSAEKAFDTTLDDEKYDVHSRKCYPIGKNMSDGT